MILRNCPWCDTNKSQLLFHYNYDYLLKINNSDKTFLDMIGFKKNDKASLVKCDECNFIFQKEDWEIDKHLINFFETENKASDENIAKIRYSSNKKFKKNN